MRIKISILAIACLAIGGLLLAFTHAQQGPVTTAKTDRLPGSSFVAERFAG